MLPGDALTAKKQEVGTVPAVEVWLKSQEQLAPHSTVAGQLDSSSHHQLSRSN